MRGLLVCLRPFTTSARHRLKNRVPEYQKLFQEDSEVPVHLKGGLRDTLLYHLTMAIGTIGCCLAIVYLGQASFPHKKQ
ncbi:cytochrome c oxidase subunit 7A1, mitochondrial [Alligator mississippiensis]|uniref:cytochrome c oxidase subunit 7A1, mitochondrial n=1 Tax=Alligator mississippiensis TaxID=8496 RepID=UPI002877B0D5|nr:cytochrome c oxidase subunit 7A1, mitochondrial [Alligator mississippiensis]